MLEQVWMIIVAIVVLGILVFVHEAGHFAVAKLCGVGVLEFSLGFGKKLFRRRWGETHYSIRAVPLGGYVRMAGEDPFDKATEGGDEVKEQTAGQNENEEEDKSQQAYEGSARGEGAITGELDWLDEKDKALLADENKWFLKKGFWAKSAIVIAGPLSNMLFAFILAVGCYWFYGAPVPDISPRIGELVPGYPAEKAGLKEGDLIKSVNGESVRSWFQLQKKIKDYSDKGVSLVLERKDSESGVTSEQVIFLQGMEDTDEMKFLNEHSPGAQVKKSYKIGITPVTVRDKVFFDEAVIGGAFQVYYISRLTFRLLKALIQGTVAPSKVVGGPISVFTGAAKSAKRGLESVIDFMVLLSVSLAIFNILPIPVLDGGHLLFFIIEAIRGGPLSLRSRAVANQVGMLLLLLLMVFAVSNDIIRLL